MAHLSGDDRSQFLLLPESVDDYVGPVNPVRFLDGFLNAASAVGLPVQALYLPCITGRTRSVGAGG